MGRKDLVLIGVVKRKKDFEIAKEQGWYRMPVEQAPKKKAKYLALYQPRVFGNQGKGISFYAQIKQVSVHKRSQLLPDEKDHPCSERLYYKLDLGPLKPTPHKISNRYWRRIGFGFTTLKKLLAAKAIGELFDIAPIEGIMAQGLKTAGIKPVAQHCIVDNKKVRYRLDFAVFCKNGKIDIECDNPKWHSQPRQRSRDKERDQWLKKRGWNVLRFTTPEIENKIEECVQRLQQTIRALGGVA